MHVKGSGTGSHFPDLSRRMQVEWRLSSGCTALIRLAIWLWYGSVAGVMASLHSSDVLELVGFCYC